MDYNDFHELRVEREADVLTVGLEKPGNGRKHSELSRLFAQVRADDVKVVVLTGAGEAFMPHADMQWYASVGEQEWLQLMREGKRLIRDMVELPQPIVVGLNGDAVGLGASIASFGDIIVASEDAVITDRHLAMGLVAGDGGALSFPLSMGVHRAKAFYLLSRPMSAHDLLDAGVVTTVVPRDQLDEAVREVVEQLVALPREALQWTKMVLNRQYQLSMLLGAEASLGHEGWSWHLQQAQASHLEIQRRAREETRRERKEP
jgi:enoyl-CoA hydratase